jgi:hypothetical protein
MMPLPMPPVRTFLRLFVLISALATPIVARAQRLDNTPRTVVMLMKSGVTRMDMFMQIASVNSARVVRADLAALPD